MESVRNPGTPGFYSRILQVPALTSNKTITKKKKKKKKEEELIYASNRSFLLNLYINKAFYDGNSQVSNSVDNGQRLGCLQRSDGCMFNVPIYSRSRKYLRFIYEHQFFLFTAFPFETFLKPWMFYKL